MVFDMARPLCIEFPGALYHLAARGNAQQPIFFDDQDRHNFLQILGKTLLDGNGNCKTVALLRPALAQLFATLNRTNKFLSNRAMRAAHFEHGYRQKEIADHLGGHDTTVSNILRRVR
jgi:hypothetical protein